MQVFKWGPAFQLSIEASNIPTWFVLKGYQFFYSIRPFVSIAATIGHLLNIEEPPPV